MEISFKNIEHAVYGSDIRKKSERFTSPQRWFIFAGSPGALRVAFLNLSYYDMVLQSHMSCETCAETLATNDLSGVNNIVLIHLSESNSNAELFRKGIAEQTGKTVHVAEKNMSIKFNKTPF